MPGTVYVIVFTNFEGAVLDAHQARNVTAWFDACSLAHCQIKWTHLYDPRRLLVTDMSASEMVLTPYLQHAQTPKGGGAEVGIHMHMHLDLVRAMGIDPITTPNGNDESDFCGSADTTGYAVLLTGYSPAERSGIIDAAKRAFQARGFDPKTFCAGYSAADPVLQSLLVGKGFTTSFAAQPLTRLTPSPPNYPSCWLRWLNWSAGHITPLTIPYRVNRYSILPPPHDNEEYLELVEMPLNMWVDNYALYNGRHPVFREDMFDLHYNWARDTGNKTVVAIGVHAEARRDEVWGRDGVSTPVKVPENVSALRVWQVIDRFLTHVQNRAKEGSVEIIYETASAVATQFLDNTTIGQVGGGIRPADPPAADPGTVIPPKK